MKKAFLLAALFLPLVTPVRGAEDPWKPFQFIIGDWIGSGSGKPGQGSGEFSLKPDLGNKVLVRRNHAEYPAREGQAQGTVHDDLMIIYPAEASGSFRAEYFDSEGHVIHYTVSPHDDKIVFLSDGASSGPRYRLTYNKKSDNSVGIDFEIAAPNQEFRRYLSGSVARK